MEQSTTLLTASLSLEVVALIAIVAAFVGYVAGTMVSRPSSTSTKFLSSAETQTDDPFTVSAQDMSYTGKLGVIDPQDAFAPERAGGDSTDASRPQISDALSYLRLLQDTFVDKPLVYAEFLHLLQSFRDQKITTMDVVSEVCRLFEGNQRLIDGFNVFLPPGFKIQDVRMAAALRDHKRKQLESGAAPPSLSSSVSDAVAPSALPSASASKPFTTTTTITTTPHPTSTSTTTTSTVTHPIPPNTHPMTTPTTHPTTTTPAVPVSASLVAPSVRHGTKKHRVPRVGEGAGERQAGQSELPAAYDAAVEYVNTVRERLGAEDPGSFLQFLDLLRQFESNETPVESVVTQARAILRNHPDLIAGFALFLPAQSPLALSLRREGGATAQDGSQPPLNTKTVHKHKHKSKKKK